jgi:integrase
MPRKPGPRVDKRARVWIAQLGPKSETTGRRGRIILKHEDGTNVRLEDKAGAYAAFARKFAEVEAAERRVAGPTAYEVVKAFLLWHEAAGSRPNTIATHEWHLFHFLDFGWGGTLYRDRAAASFAVPDWSRYRKAMLAKGAETGYVRLAYSSIHACWRWASRPIEDREPLKLIPENPFQGLPRPKKGDKRKLVLPWATIKAVAAMIGPYVEREATGHRNRLVATNRERARNRLKALACRLIVECGCRPVEAAVLRWDWVHEDRRLIEIPREFIKTHEDRQMGLTREMADTLARLRESGGTHPKWVFRPADDPSREEPDPHRLAEWFAGLRAAARAAGVVLPEGTSLYTFRHSLITLAREAGMELRDMAPAFGHTEETAEENYLHVGGAHIVGVMDEARARIEEKEGRDRAGRAGGPRS